MGRDPGMQRQLASTEHALCRRGSKNERERETREELGPKDGASFSAAAK